MTKAYDVVFPNLAGIGDTSARAAFVVRKDGTVRIDNELFEVNLALRGLRVELELDPWILDPVFVRYKGQDFGRARKVDRHLNARLGGTEDRP